METRSVGSLQASLAGLGCASFGWWIDERRSRDVIHAALDAGINFFDCADEYGEGRAEEYLGRALGSKRHEALIVTKFAGAKPDDGTPPGSAQWVRHSCERSLRRLGTDWIDLYLIHHPDPSTPISETLEALKGLQRDGWIREIGCSNLDAGQLLEAKAAADALGMGGFRTLECGYSLLDRTAETGIVPLCQDLDMTVLPYFPLASGMLTGKYRRNEPTAQAGRMDKYLNGAKVKDYFPALFTDRSFDVVEALDAYARDHGRRLSELALAWIASQSWVGSVISGATSPAQVRQNVSAIDWKLSRDECEEVAALTTTEHAFTWLFGSPSYTSPPPGTDLAATPRVISVTPGLQA